MTITEAGDCTNDQSKQILERKSRAHRRKYLTTRRHNRRVNDQQGIYILPQQVCLGPLLRGDVMLKVSVEIHRCIRELGRVYIHTTMPVRVRKIRESCNTKPSIAISRQLNKRNASNEGRISAPRKPQQNATYIESVLPLTSSSSPTTHSTPPTPALQQRPQLLT